MEGEYALGKTVLPKKIYFLNLLLPLLALAKAGKNAGPAYQKLLWPSQYQNEMNL